MKTTFLTSSLCRRRKKSSLFVLKALPSALLLVFSQAGWADLPINAGGAAAGLPANGVVAVPGSVTHTVDANQLTINQIADKAVIDWASFNIDAGKTVHFAQPSAGAILNRVRVGNDPSQIFGTLSATGTVMLMNPNGVMFGRDSVVNVGSLIATTGTVDESNFSKTSAQITGATRGVITNQGTITASAGGLVALVAPSVINQKVIAATGGTIALLGSSAATISLNNGLYEFAIPGGATGTRVTNAVGASLNAANIHLGVGDAANLLSGVINLEGVQQATNAIVVNGHTVELKSALQAASVSGNSTTVNVSSGARIQDGVNIAAAGGTVNVGAGTFNENVSITKALTLDGAGVGQTVLQSASAGSGDAVTINNASDVTLSDFSIADYLYGLRINGTSHNVTVDRLAFNNNTYGMRNGTATRADNFRMLNSSITGGQIGVQTYNSYQLVGGAPVATGSFSNALFENVTIDGPSFKGFYLETANDLTLRNVTVINAGNYGAPASSSQHRQYGSGIDINLKYDAFNSINFDNVVVRNSGASSGDPTAAAVVIKTRGIAGDSSSYTPAPASLQSVNISGGSIEDSASAGLRIETLSNGSGGQPAVTISGGTQFKNNGKDIVVDKTDIDARGAVFVGAANGFAVEDRVTHALDSVTRGLVTWTAGNVYVTQNSGSIQRGVNAASAGHTVNIGAGTFTEQVVLDKAGMTLAGSEGARIVVPDLAEVNGVRIQANNVTVAGMEIAGPVDQPYLSYAWGSNISRGIAVGNGVAGFNISNNNIHDVRNGILIDGRNTGSVTGNRIDNTKSGISVQYTDGTGITISGNTQGTLGNEWGLNLHLNGHMVGSNIVSNSTPISTDPTLGWQESLLDLSTANNGWSVQDQAYTSSNRTHVAVAAGGSASSQGSQLTPLNTVQAGVNAVVTGGTVNVAAGTYVQPATLLVNKSLTLAGAGQSDTTIDARGVSGYGIQVTADDVTLRDFTLYGPSANVASSYGIKVAPAGPGASARLHDFSISNVTIRGSGRAELDLNGVDRALIDHVTADGAPVGNDSGTTQGAGIQLTDSANVTVRNSTTRNNSWGGLALYQANRHYNQQVNNITVESSNNFTEVNPVYMQDESASRDFGALNIAGFDYAVRNAAQDQYTWLQATQQKAFDFGVNLGDASSSYVQGWNGAAATQDFHVGVGNLTGGGTRALSINTALGHAVDGANIRVGAGRYAENVAISNPYNLYFSGSIVGSLTLHTGASGTGISGTVTADGAGGFLFNAPIRLLGDTTLATQGANITFNGDVQNAGGGARALRLIAGSGGTRGNVHMTTGGSAAGPLGQLDISANQFSLASTLWVKGYKIDALGNVTLSNNTLRAQDAGAANTLNAGGNVTGSTISQGSVAVVSAGDIEANIAGTDVVAQAQGSMDVVVTASQTATLTADTIVASVTAADVVAQSQGDMNMVVSASNSASLTGDSVVANVTAPVVAVEAVNDAQISGAASQITLDAPRGSVSGSFGQVSNTGGGLVNVNGKPQGNQTLSSNSENNRVVPAGGVLDNAAEGGGLQLAQAGGPALQGGSDVVMSTPEAAGDAVDSGRAVELDMSPRKRGQDKNTEKNQERDREKE